MEKSSSFNPINGDKNGKNAPKHIEIIYHLKKSFTTLRYRNCYHTIGKKLSDINISNL